MKWKKKLIFMAILVGISTVVSFASASEKSVADTYRQLLNSNNFYIEYSRIYNKRSIVLAVAKKGDASWTGNPRKKRNGILHTNGKCYVVHGKKAILMKENENKILPEEFSMFYQENMSDDVNDKILSYRGSTKRMIKSTSYDCDQYEINIKSADGTVIANKIYNVLYDSGKLYCIQKCVEKDNHEEVIESIMVLEISSKIPDERFILENGTEIYANQEGNMSDLIKEKVMIGRVGVNYVP